MILCSGETDDGSDFDVYMRHSMLFSVPFDTISIPTLHANLFLTSLCVCCMSTTYAVPYLYDSLSLLLLTPSWGQLDGVRVAIDWNFGGTKLSYIIDHPWLSHTIFRHRKNGKTNTLSTIGFSAIFQRYEREAG